MKSLSILERLQRHGVGLRRLEADRALSGAAEAIRPPCEADGGIGPTSERRPSALAPVPPSSEELGAISIVETVHPTGSCHGDWPIGPLDHRAAAAVSWAAGEPRSAEVFPGGRPYIDTETTGLHAGAGSLVFLLGVGRYEARGFVVRQYFLRDPTAEEQYWRRVHQDISGARVLVSFHGKSFDRPRLRDRCLFHRQDPLFEDWPHVDLYHASRRLWKDSLPDVRLQTLERHQLGFVRSCDLPGSECPQAYFQWLRGEADRTPEILLHNRLDILSLAALECKISAVFEAALGGDVAWRAAFLAWEAGATEVAIPMIGNLRQSPIPAPAGLIPKLASSLARRQQNQLAIAVLEHEYAARRETPTLWKWARLLEQSGEWERVFALTQTHSLAATPPWPARWLRLRGRAIRRLARPQVRV